MSDHKKPKHRVGAGEPPKSGDEYGFVEGMERIGRGDLGRRIVAAAEKVEWKEQPPPIADNPFSGRAWTGNHGGFHFVIMDFELESQGFPGERGADGAVRTPNNEVLRLGHEFSAHVVSLARKQRGIS